MKGLDAALVPLVASLGCWGVEEAHWLPAQLAVTLAGLGVPDEVARTARVLVSSAQEEALLFEE